MGGETIRHAKLEAVLDAARSIFFEHGFSAATTDMIQRRAGVSKSTLYAYFPSKEALFVAVVESENAVFIHTLESIRFRPGTLEETLHFIGKAYLRIILSPGTLALYRVIVSEASRFPQLAHGFYESGPRMFNAKLAELFTLAEASGEMRLEGLEKTEAAGAFVGLLRGESQLQYVTHVNTKPAQSQIENWVRIAVTTFLRAYGT